MNPKSILDLFNRFLLTGLEKEIFFAVETHKLEEVSSRLSMTPRKRLGMISNGGISIAEYLDVLEKNSYSAVFDDGSILYVECVFEANRLLDHRYFYIPCPFSEETVRSKPDHFALVDWLRDSAELEGQDVFRSRGTFRFDCVRNAPASVDPHPVSHLTFASGDCRMPLRGPFQISAFLNFIFDNFFRDYRPIWLSFAPYMKLDESEVTITEPETVQHHLNWDPAS